MSKSAACVLVLWFLLFLGSIQNNHHSPKQAAKKIRLNETEVVILTCSTKAEVMLKEALNVCENMPWTGFYTKIIGAYQTIKTMQNKSLVAFVDSDVIKNVGNIKTELKTAWALYNSTKVLFSTEPFCWVGRNCNDEDFYKFYKNSAHWRGYNFLNSGGYIGTADAISAALELIIEEFDPNGFDDQYSATELFRRGIVELDYDNVFFSSFIDAKPWKLRNLLRQPSSLYKKNMRPSCITGLQFAKHGCGWNPPKWRVNSNCSVVSKAWRTRPLFIHFNGAGHKSRAKMNGVKNAIEACASVRLA